MKKDIEEQVGTLMTIYGQDFKQDGISKESLLFIVQNNGPPLGLGVNLGVNMVHGTVFY